MYVVQPINYRRVYKTGEMIILGCKKGLTKKANGDPIKVCINGKWTQSSFKCGGISFFFIGWSFLILDPSTILIKTSQRISIDTAFKDRLSPPHPPPPIPPLCTWGAISSLVFNSKPHSNYILVASLLLLRRDNWSKLNVKKTWNCLFLKSYYAVHVFHWISKLTPFITSILKSLMILAIWLALNSVIYSRIALLFFVL